ncbi:hypothetical protein TSAR_015311 [Trichomalopsis sarcophagae]|uniref:Uncharacterized protein n=1 Tax=Trichomalopsis sarcophagae TaxID=543379 RepID=A0A232EDI0_9HYME|nr:hypothetical protein TSAR_015311 [Trichomalopsis sarcophagae]
MPKARKRGRYKKYLTNDREVIPESTLRSRKKCNEYLPSSDSDPDCDNDQETLNNHEQDYIQQLLQGHCDNDQETLNNHEQDVNIIKDSTDDLSNYSINGDVEMTYESDDSNNSYISLNANSFYEDDDDDDDNHDADDIDIYNDFVNEQRICEIFNDEANQDVNLQASTSAAARQLGPRVSDSITSNNKHRKGQLHADIFSPSIIAPFRAEQRHVVRAPHSYVLLRLVRHSEQPHASFASTNAAQTNSSLRQQLVNEFVAPNFAAITASQSPSFITLIIERFCRTQRAVPASSEASSRRPPNIAGLSTWQQQFTTQRVNISSRTSTRAPRVSDSITSNNKHRISRRAKANFTSACKGQLHADIFSPSIIAPFRAEQRHVVPHSHVLLRLVRHSEQPHASFASTNAAQTNSSLRQQLVNEFVDPNFAAITASQSPSFITLIIERFCRTQRAVPASSEASSRRPPNIAGLSTWQQQFTTQRYLRPHSRHRRPGTSRHPRILSEGRLSTPATQGSWSSASTSSTTDIKDIPKGLDAAQQPDEDTEAQADIFFSPSITGHRLLRTTWRLWPTMNIIFRHRSLAAQQPSTTAANASRTAFAAFFPGRALSTGTYHRTSGSPPLSLVGE